METGSIWDNVKHVKQFKPYISSFIKKNNYVHYATDFICLDTETSHNHATDKEKIQGWIYQYCFYYQGIYYIGRYIDDFITALTQIKQLYKDEKQTTVIFIHNLSYDIQYIKDFLFDKFGNEFKMLVVEPHKFISFSIAGFEFRCTYRLTNRSLDNWCKEMNTQHKKLVGTIDYDTIRYPFTKLNKKDWKYQIYDVVSMVEALNKQMSIHKDNIATLPLTSTSYVRREARKIFKENYEHNRKQFINTRLDLDTYRLCNLAFAGGLTHANRFLINQTIDGNIRHRDFTSHYPSQQRCKYAPIGKFNLIGENIKFTQLNKYTHDYCLLCEITFENIRLKSNKITLPYLQESKVRQGHITPLNIISDNGRILKCDGLFKICVTELDLDIITRQYDYDGYNINVAYGSIKGNFPKWLCDLVDNFFKWKSETKEQIKEIEEKINQLKKQGIYNNEYDNFLNDLKIDNSIAKAWLNSIYGMSATNPIRLKYDYNVNNGKFKLKAINREELSDLLDKFYKSKNNFMSYQLGIWTTAHARHELMQFVELIGYDKFLYADTDSIFYLSDEQTEQKIDDLNKQFKQECDEKHFYIETEKKRYYYHQFEDENENIIKFRMLHSKCYAYVMDNNEMKCTIAGVTKNGGGITREQELKTIDNLKPFFTFTKCGGTSCTYVERNSNTNSCAIISKTTKTLKNMIDELDEIYLMED